MQKIWHLLVAFQLLSIYLFLNLNLWYRLCVPTYIWTSKFVFSHLIEEVYAWCLLVICNLQSLILHRNCHLHPSHWTARHTMWGISFLFFYVFTWYFSIRYLECVDPKCKCIMVCISLSTCHWNGNIRISPFNKYRKTLNSNVQDWKGFCKTQHVSMANACNSINMFLNFPIHYTGWISVVWMESLP